MRPPPPRHPAHKHSRHSSLIWAHGHDLCNAPCKGAGSQAHGSTEQEPTGALTSLGGEETSSPGPQQSPKHLRPLSFQVVKNKGLIFSQETHQRTMTGHLPETPACPQRHVSERLRAEEGRAQGRQQLVSLCAPSPGSGKAEQSYCSVNRL